MSVPGSKTDFPGMTAIVKFFGCRLRPASEKLHNSALEGRSGFGGYCCKSRKSNETKNSAKVFDVSTAAKPRSADTHGLVVNCLPTLPRYPPRVFRYEINISHYTNGFRVVRNLQ